MKKIENVKRPEGLNTHTHTHTRITKKGGYRCSFLFERWCHALDCMTRDCLC